MSASQFVPYKKFASGSTKGKPIAILSTAVILHTSTSTSNRMDQGALYFSNTASTAYDLTILVDGTTAHITELDAQGTQDLSFAFSLGSGYAITASTTTTGSGSIFMTAADINHVNTEA